MQNRILKVFYNQKRGGFILLFGLLAVVILGMILYFKLIAGPGVDIKSGERLGNPPWKQWADIEKHLHRKDLGEPSSEQPEIAETIGLTAQLYEGTDRKGKISLVFNPDNTVIGDWGGTFFVDPNMTVEHELAMCNFKGYLVPDETQLDVESEYGPEYIYFLTSGGFTAVEYRKSRVRRVSGAIYVNGWLGPDFTIEKGQVIITSDKKHFKMFTFSGQAGKIKTPNFKLLFKK